MTDGPYIRSWRWPLSHEYAYYRSKYGPIRVLIEQREGPVLRIEDFEWTPTAEDIILLAYDGPECD